MPERTRADVPDRYRWDLTQIFDSPAAWSDAESTLSEQVAAVEATAQGPIESGEAFRDRLASISDIYRQLQRLSLYADLRWNVRADPEADRRRRRVRSLRREVEAATARVVQTLRASDVERLRDLVADGDEWGHFADSMLAETAHCREPAVEDVIGAFEGARTGPDRTLRAVVEDDFEPPSVDRPDGESVTVTRRRYRTELAHPDRAYRRAVYRSYRSALRDYQGTIATAFVEKLDVASSLAAVRDYDSLRAQQFHQRCYPETGLRAQLPVAVHDTMLGTVETVLDPLERYRHAHRDALGVERLRPWDLEVAPEPSESLEIPYEEATELVVGAVAPLGDGYQQRLREFLSDDRVDVYGYEEKRSDVLAYCPSSADDGAFVLLNYHDDLQSLFEFCHELGHAMHVDHHRSGPPQYATCPRPLEEVPSLLHEILLTEHLLEQGGPRATHARARLRSNLAGCFYGQTLWSAFKHATATAVEADEHPDGEWIAETFIEHRRRYDPVVDWPQASRWDWLNSSLAREPYHHYQYVLGATGALAVRADLAAGELTPSAYRTTLRESGRRPATESFQRLGLDLRTAAPYERAAGQFSEYL